MENQVLVCKHCGNKTSHAILFSKGGQDELYSLRDPADIMYADIVYYLCECSTCNALSLYIASEYDNDPGNLLTASVLYPHEKNITGDVPDNVYSNYHEAKKVEKISGVAFAVMIRRALESICLEQNAKGKTLKDKLDNLAERGIIPEILIKMGHTLRFLGNLGAHASNYKIDGNEIRAIDDFFLTMLEYIYIAPSKLNRLKKSIDNKTEKKAK